MADDDNDRKPAALDEESVKEVSLEPPSAAVEAAASTSDEEEKKSSEKDIMSNNGRAKGHDENCEGDHNVGQLKSPPEEKGDVESPPAEQSSFPTAAAASVTGDLEETTGSSLKTSPPEDDSSQDDPTLVPGVAMFVPGPNYSGTGIHTGYNSDNGSNHTMEDAAISGATDTIGAEIHVPSAYVVDEENIEIAEAEEVKPYFQRKEGQLTIIIVGGLIACLVILLGVLLSRTEGGTSPNGGVGEIQITEIPSMAPSFDPRPTLAIVRDRGAVNCGVEDASREGTVNLADYNIDQCQALAAMIFGDPTKMNLILVGQEDRYERLIGRELDVLFAGDTYSLERTIREPTSGEALAFGYPYFGAFIIYLGVEKYIQCVNEQKRYDECKELSICAADTPQIRTLITSFFPVSFITFGPFSQMESSLKNGTCNVLLSDTYRIYGSKNGLQGDITNGKYIFSDYYISRNLLSSVVRSDDLIWFDVVQASSHASHRATQLGIGKGSGESQCTSDSSANNEISLYNVPRCVGNSEETFLKNLGSRIVSYYPGYAKLPSIAAPAFGSLECDDCADVLNDGRLKSIIERGYINCAVFLDPSYNLTMSSLATIVNVQFCKIYSVAIFQGKVDAVNITYIDEMDYPSIPQEFDVVAGVAWESRFGVGLETGLDFDINKLGRIIPCIPYYFHDKIRYNGREYGGSGLALTYVVDKADNSLAQIGNAIISATIYAQRQGITRANHIDMPLIHLFGDALTFVFRDVIMYAGNYDDIIDEAIAASDGATERGWNSVVQDFGLVPNLGLGRTEPVYYCDYTDSCIEPCEWNSDGGFFICTNPS